MGAGACAASDANRQQFKASDSTACAQGHVCLCWLPLQVEKHQRPEKKRGEAKGTLACSGCGASVSQDMRVVYVGIHAGHAGCACRHTYGFNRVH